MMTTRIEALLNRGLKDSPRARELVRELENRRLAIRVESTPWWVTLASDGVALALVYGQAAPEQPEATLRGTPIALLSLLGNSPQDAFQRGRLTIEGDALVAQRFQTLLRLLRPDIEEELSRLIGDQGAHRLAGLAAAAIGWGRRAGDTALRNVAEFLAHERGDLIPRGEAEALYVGIERLSDDLQRLAARIALLEQAAPGRGGGQDAS